jgi:hypothetical protein
MAPQETLEEARGRPETEPALSIVSLGLLAAFTAVSMWLVSSGLGATLVSRSLRSSYNAVAPALATLSLSFGVWYGTAAWGLALYPF